MGNEVSSVQHSELGRGGIPGPFKPGEAFQALVRNLENLPAKSKELLPRLGLQSASASTVLASPLPAPPDGGIRSPPENRAETEAGPAPSQEPLPTKKGSRSPRLAQHYNHQVWKNSDVQLQNLYVADVGHLVPNFYTFGFKMKHWCEYWAFLNTGEVYYGLPLRPFDYDHEKRAHPYRFEPYEQSSNMTLSFDYEGKSVALRAGQESVPLSPRTVFRLVTPCKGSTLAGTFSHDACVDMEECLTSGGGISQETTLEFAPNGRFVVNGMQPLLEVLKATKSQQKTSTDSAESMSHYDYNAGGTYKVGEHQLTLNFKDGTEVSPFFYRFPGREEQVLNINGLSFYKKDSSHS